LELLRARRRANETVELEEEKRIVPERKKIRSTDTQEKIRGVEC